LNEDATSIVDKEAEQMRGLCREQSIWGDLREVRRE